MVHKKDIQVILSDFFPEKISNIILEYLFAGSFLNRQVLIEALKDIWQDLEIPDSFLLLVIRYYGIVEKDLPETSDPPQKKTKIKTCMDVVVRTYYNNGSKFYASSSGNTYRHGAEYGYIDEHHVVLSYYLGNWKITIPIYVILNSNSRTKTAVDEYASDDDMIHFYYSPELENLINKEIRLLKKDKLRRKKNKKESVTRFTVDFPQVIVVNKQERNYMLDSRVNKTIYLGTKEFQQKLEILAYKYKKKKPDIGDISDTDYWYIDIGDDIANIHILTGKKRQRVIDLDYIYKQILVVRKLLTSNIQEILERDINIHTKLKKIKKIATQYLQPIKQRIKFVLQGQLNLEF